MMSRTIRYTLVSMLSLAIAGPALAQEVPEEEGTGEEGMGDATGEGGDAAAAPETGMEGGPAMMGGETPIEWVKRPINNQKGRLDAGVDIGLPKGPNNEGELALAAWIGFTLRADYGVMDKLQVGARIPLVLVKPGDLCDVIGCKTLGGVNVVALYSLMEMLSARVNVGFLYQGGAALGPYGVPLYGGDMKLAFGAGVAFKKVFGEKLAVTADPGLFFQLDGAVGADGAEMLQLLMIPVGVHFQAMPALVAGLRTGFNSGHKFKFSADDGATLPVIVEAAYTLMNGKLDVGLDVGLGSLMVPEGASAGDTLFIGLFATWRNK